MLAALGCNPSHTWTFADGKAGGDNPASAMPLGTLAYSPDGGLYRCVEAAAAITQYATCGIKGAWKAEVSTASLAVGARCGVAQAAIANGARGWLLVDGDGQVSVAASTAAETSLGAIAAGALDDQTTDLIAGIQLTAARGTGAGPAPCTVQWPFKLN